MKKKILIVLAVITALIITTVVSINVTQEKNEKRAEEIAPKLMGTTFSGSRRDTKTIDKGGAIKLSAFTDTEIVCEFKNDGTVVVTTTKSYCDGMAIMNNGHMIYDEVETETKEYTVGEFEISLGGNIKIEIGNLSCSLIVDDDDDPVSLVINGVMCELQ